MPELAAHIVKPPPLMQELEPTFRRAISVWWLIMWRGVVLGLIVAGVPVFVIGLIIGAVGVSLEASPVATGLAGLVGVSIGVAWHIYVVRMALRKHYAGFRLALVTREATEYRPSHAYRGLREGAMQIIFISLYFALGIAQIAAYLAGVKLWLGVGTFLGLIIFFGTAALPFGSIADVAIAFYGAYAAWGWEWWQAALLTFPFAIIGVLAMGLDGVVGVARATFRRTQVG